MNSKLRSVAVFYEPTQAHLALNCLSDEGIKACLSNEAIVANDWLIGTAIGNIQMQVQDKDYEWAYSTLNKKSDVPEDELDQLALKANSELPVKPIFSFFYPANIPESETLSSTWEEGMGDREDSQVQPNPRELLVERAFRAGIIFIFCFYLSPLLTWMLIDIANQEESLRPQYRTKLVWAYVLHIPVTFGFILLLRMLFFA